MKKLTSLFALVFLATLFIRAQLAIQPIIPEDSMISNVLCYMTDTLQWYRVITPVNGMMELFATASVPDTGSPEEFQFLGVEVLGKNLNGAFGQVYQGGNASGAFYPYVGNSGVPLKDTSYTCCMAADTFYIRVDVSLISTSCWSYTLKWHTLPATYQTNGQTNQYPDTLQFLPYNTPETGNLGFENIAGGSGDGNNGWLIVPPIDGTLKLNVSVEAESGAGNWMDITPYFETPSGGFEASQYPTLGAFQSPLDTSLYWDCWSGGDTFLLETNLGQYGDGGGSYQISYTMIAPVFNNDPEPNNSFAEADTVNPEYPIEGHVSFQGENDDDYYIFYKPDTGFLKIYGFIESAVTVSPGAYIYVTLYDSVQNTVANFYPLIGGNSQPAGDTLSVNSLSPGWYYLYVEHSSSCISYKFQITTPTISSIHTPGAIQSLNIFPNPTSSSFTVDFGDTRNTSINVYNEIGELVETRIQGNERYVVFGENLTSGLYLLKATNSVGEIVSQGRLVKVK